jgi:hypothetical protein
MTTYARDNPNYNVFNEAICTDYVLYILHSAMPNTDLSQLSRIPSLLANQLDEAAQNGGVITFQRGAGEDVTFDTKLGTFQPDANAPNFSSHQRFNETDPGPFNYASGYVDQNGQSHELASLVRFDDDSGQFTAANGTVINFGQGTFGDFSETNGVMTIGSPTAGAVRFISVDSITGNASISGGYQAPTGSTILVASNSINVVQQQTTSTQTTTLNWDGELERITKLNNDLSSAIQEFDPRNTHPYTELDIDEDATGKPTAVQLKFDGQPNTTADFSAVGQVLGSALGRALAPNNQFVQLAAGTVVGAIGQKLAQAFAASLTTNGAAFDPASVFTNFNVSLAGAGASSVASFLVAELGTELGFKGFGAQLFNTAAGGFTGSVASQIASKMAATPGLTFDAAIAGLDFAAAATNAAYGVSSLFGSFLGNELVPAQTHEGAVGGQLLGAVGSAIGITAAVANLLGSALNFILPGVGSLIGTILGTLIGNAFGNVPHPAAVDLIDQQGYLYGSTHYQVSASDGGDYGIADPMAHAAISIVNAYLTSVKGAALDHSKQALVGYLTDPSAFYINGVPGHPVNGQFLKPDGAVQAAALDVLQHTEVIGGDLLMKRAHQDSTSNHPQVLPPPDPTTLNGDPGTTGAPTPSLASAAEQLAVMSGDLGVAQDYENYLNNREAINALMAANPDSAFTAGWIATFARVNELGLNHVNPSDFLGGLVGWLDSVGKAGLSFNAAGVSVSPSGGGNVTVAIKVANGTDVPGALSAFADQVGQSSDASGTTVQLVFANALAAGGFHVPASATLVSGTWQVTGGAGNNLWFGGDGAASVFNGAGDGNDILVGGAMNDSIYAGNGWNFVDGGAATITSSAAAATTSCTAAGVTTIWPAATATTLTCSTAATARTRWPIPAAWIRWCSAPGIAALDISVAVSKQQSDRGVKDPAHPGAPTEWITLQDRSLADNRIAATCC